MNDVQLNCTRPVLTYLIYNKCHISALQDFIILRYIFQLDFHYVKLCHEVLQEMLITVAYYLHQKDICSKTRKLREARETLFALDRSFVERYSEIVFTWAGGIMSGNVSY